MARKSQAPALVTVAELATKIGVDRSSLHRRVKREGVETTPVERITNAGIQKMTAVPAEWAEALIARYEAARVGS